MSAKRIPWNKGKLGEKHLLFKQNKPILCIHHGLHSNWSYNKNHRQIACRFCAKERDKKHKYERPFNKFLNYIRCRGNKRGQANNITEAYIANLYLKQGGFCALSGLPLHESVMSLDRINSEKGYIKGNLQWLHIMVNRMKSDFKQREFINMCKLISNNYNKDRSDEIKKVIKKADRDSRKLNKN